MRTFEAYARYYDLLYRDKDYASEARFVDSLLQTAGQGRGSLLDVGCGTGAHAREFAKLGWKPAGVDLSTQMLEIARQRTDPTLAIEYFEGVASEFALSRTFEAVVSLFHVASYQSGPHEAFRMFENMRRHLLPGGVLVFDFWHGAGVLADPPAVRVRRKKDDRIRVTRISEPTHRAVDCRIDVTYEVMIEEVASGKTERVQELHRMRYFFRPELEFMLGRAGFVVERCYAGLTTNELDDRAWYGLMVARAV